MTKNAYDVLREFLEVAARWHDAVPSDPQGRDIELRAFIVRAAADFRQIPNPKRKGR